MARTEYGIQMYSLRDITGKDLKGALKTVADQGYKYIEFAGFFENSAEDVKSWLDEYGLICSGTHTGIDPITEANIQETIKYHQTIGCKNLIVPGADWSTEEKMNYNIEVMNKAAPVLKAAGITLGYHNHSHEFFPTSYGKLIHKEIEEHCPDVEFELDTFWVFNANLDPIAEIERLKDRVRVIHLKDGIPSGDGSHNAQGKSVGEGKAPIKAIREKALELGLLMVIESEGLDPTGTEEVGRCIKYLRTLD